MTNAFYIETIPGKNNTNIVCQFHKTLWAQTIFKKMVYKICKDYHIYGIKTSQLDPTLFIKHSQTRNLTLLVYIDDIIGRMMGNDDKCVSNEFGIKDLGKLKYFLGIEVARLKQGIFISQQKYVIGLQREIGNLRCKPVTLLLEPNHKRGEAKEDDVVDKEMYQKLISKLIYLSHKRPNITYVVSVVSQFMHGPKNVIYRLFKGYYNILKGTLAKAFYIEQEQDLKLKHIQILIM